MRQLIARPARDGSCRWSSRISTSSSAATASASRSAPSRADLAACDVVYVAPDVPTDDAGAKRSRADRRAARRQCSQAARTDAVARRAVARCRRASRARRARRGRMLYYQVETLIFGRAVERATGAGALHRRLRRSRRSRCRAAIATFLRRVRLPDPADALRKRGARQDLDQLAASSRRVSVANTLAELCESIGADWAEIAPALKLDRRIGQHAYLSRRASASPAAISSAISRPWCVMSSRTRQRCRRRALLHVEQRAPQGLAAAHAARGGAVTNRCADDRRAGAGLQGKHALDQEFAGARADSRLGALAVAGLRSGGAGSGGAAPQFRSAASPLDAANEVDALAVMTPWPQFRLPCDALARGCAAES